MSRLNSIELFEDTRQVVIAENASLPQLDGSQLTGLVSKVNNKIGNIEIVAGSGLVTIGNGATDKQISIDVDIPNIASLFVQLNGTNVVADTYTITYDAVHYLVTVRHNLNARVVGFLFDENDKQAFYGVDYVDDNTISIQFEESTFPNSENVWKLSLGLGGGLPITLSTALPSDESTDAMVPSSKAVYNFVTSQISFTSEEFEEFKTATNESFQAIDANFEEVSNAFTSVRADFAEADNVLNQKIDTEIAKIQNTVNDINKTLKNIAWLLDEVNGVEHASDEEYIDDDSSEESSDEEYSSEESSTSTILVRETSSNNEYTFTRFPAGDAHIVQPSYSIDMNAYAWRANDVIVYSQKLEPLVDDIVASVEGYGIMTNENFSTVSNYGVVLEQ